MSGKVLVTEAQRQINKASNTHNNLSSVPRSKSFSKHRVNASYAGKRSIASYSSVRKLAPASPKNQLSSSLNKTEIKIDGSYNKYHKG